MTDNKTKEKFMAIPIEEHDTASWANMEKQQPITNVNIPNEQEVDNAKDYVDTNQK